MHIYIIRHAYAYEHGDPRWPDDSRRPLSPEGAARFQQGAELLAERGLAPEVIATSPYVRCRQTGDIVARAAGGVEVVELAALAPGSDLEEVVRWSNAQTAESMAWVGHSPDVGFMAAALIGEGDAAIRFAKGAVAAIRVDGELARGGGELLWHATLKSLGV